MILPSYGQTRDFPYPHIEIDSMGLLHYGVVERRQELDMRTTNSLNNLLIGFFQVSVFQWLVNLN
jgi:hypothetical protein